MPKGQRHRPLLRFQRSTRQIRRIRALDHMDQRALTQDWRGTGRQRIQLYVARVVTRAILTYATLPD